MNAKAWRLYAAGDARLEDVELEGAGEDGVVVEIVTNTICLSDYKAVSLGTGHKRVPKDIASNPTMFGHEISGIVREVGAKWASQFAVGQHVCIQPAFNIPGHELETMGYAWHSIGGETTHVYLPSIIMEMGCLLPYDGDAFFKCSLAEPISCIVSAFRTNYHHAFGSGRNDAAHGRMRRDGARLHRHRLPFAREASASPRRHRHRRRAACARGADVWDSSEHSSDIWAGECG